MTQIDRRVAEALFDSDLVATRLILGVAEAMWAISLWWPGDSFERAIYGGMAAVLPEDAWGLIFALSSATQLSIVALGKFNSPGAFVFAGWNAVLWCFVCTSLLFAVYPPPAALSGEAVLAMAATWVWVRPMLLAHWYHKALHVCR